MHFTKTFAAMLLIGTAACQVTTTPENADTTAEANQEAATNQAAAAQVDAIEQYKAEAEQRAKALAMQGGSEQQRAQARQQARQQLQGLRFEVDISDRKIRAFQGDRKVAEHDVAVGTKEWPTPTGSWEFHRVDLNPEWVPPKDESWAAEEQTQAPGSPDNPMGRARLVYRMPNTVHGTDDLNSLGKASSHGSIRVANDVVLQLAQTLLKAGGSWEGPQWFQQMTQNRTEEYQIKMQQRIPIKVQE